MSRIEINKTLSEPLEIGEAADLSSIVVGENVQAHLVLRTAEDSKLDLRLMPQAKVTLYCLGTSSSQKSHSLSAQVLADAELSIFEFGLMSDKTMRFTTVELLKPGAQVNYYALDQLDGEANKKTELTIHHRSPSTTSTQAFRGIYAGSSKASFLGKVVIAQNAKLSCASQLYKSILLSEEAKAFVMPQLEIYNHDIKASHGASIGELDEQALFYLCSRGLPRKQAKAMLLHSLLNDILDGILEPTLKHRFTKLVTESVEQALGAHHEH